MIKGRAAGKWTKRLFSARRASLLLAAVLLGVMMLALSLLTWQFVRNNVLTARQEMVRYLGETLRYRADLLLVPAENRLKLLSHSSLPRADTLAKRVQLINLMHDLFVDGPAMDAFYIGYPDGDIVLFRPLFSRVARLRFGAPAGAVMMVQSLEKGVGERLYFDSAGQLLLRRPSQGGQQQDVLMRTWYRQVENTARGVISKPYMLAETRSLGMSVSYRSPNGAVLSIDLNLRSLGNVLDRMRMTEGTRIALTTLSGKLLAYSEPARIFARSLERDGELVDIATLAEEPLAKAYDWQPDSEHWVTTQDEQRWWVDALTIQGANSSSRFLLLVAVPEHEALHEAGSIIKMLGGMGLVILLLSLGGVLLFVNAFVMPLRRLVDDTRALAGFDFSPRQLPRYRIREVQALALALENMREMIAGFMKTSAVLGSEKDLQGLLEALLQSLVDAAHCEGAAIYLSESGDTLAGTHVADSDEAHLRCHKYLDIEKFASNACPWPERIALAQSAHPHPVLEAAQSLRTVQGEAFGYWLIAAPLRTQARELMGVLSLRVSENRLKLLAQALPGFIETLANNLTAAIEIRQMLVEQKNLLGGLARVVGGAIDARSAHLGIHSRRVPEIASALAEAAHKAKHGELAAFRMTDADREALFLAAWLHDCGKIATPEYVIEKGSKLEMLYNRIHEVRMRFELLKSDALVSVLLTSTEEAKCRQALQDVQAVHAQLDEEFSFVARCNLGGQRLCDEDIRRLESIGARRWLRTLDDRLGLSPAEISRRQSTPPTPFPVWEKLLDDKLWHCIEHDDSLPNLQADNRWGFILRPSRWLRNSGELHNLCIREGTLTEEDRYVIKHHIVQTIIMLEAMPFPPHLRHVPEIAGAHHERMDGRGYPRGLRGDQMSVLARIMTIADIFEALTSDKRPYKAGFDQDEALRVMQAMVDDGHIDGTLFRLFVDSGTARRYLQRHA